MDRLSKIIIAIGIILALTTALYLLFFIPQYKFLSEEIQAVKMSSPIQIKEVLVFGSGMPIFSLISGNNFIRFETSNLSVLYNGFYVPSYFVIGDVHFISTPFSMGDYVPSLIGQKVYLDFFTHENLNPNQSISAPYIVKSEVIKNKIEYWNFTFDGNISKVITIENMTFSEAGHFTNEIDGIVLQNGTALLSPSNPFVGGFVSYFPFPFSYLFEINIGIASIFIILIAIKIKRKIKKGDKNERQH